MSNMSDIDAIKGKIRALCSDFLQYTSEVRIKEEEDVFTLSEEKINSVVTVKINGVATTDYTYSSTYGTIETTASGFTVGDAVEIFYGYYSYTSTELDSYIRASLVFISLYSSIYTDYELEDDEIFPTPDNAVTDLICIIASILIKPNYKKYSLPGGVTIDYPKNICKEDKIQKLIREFEAGNGITDLLTAS